MQSWPSWRVHHACIKGLKLSLCLLKFFLILFFFLYILPFFITRIQSWKIICNCKYLIKNKNKKNHNLYSTISILASYSSNFLISLSRIELEKTNSSYIFKNEMIIIIVMIRCSVMMSFSGSTISVLVVLHNINTLPAWFNRSRLIIFSTILPNNSFWL